MSEDFHFSKLGQFYNRNPEVLAKVRSKSYFTCSSEQPCPNKLIKVRRSLAKPGKCGLCKSDLKKDI